MDGQFHFCEFCGEFLINEKHQSSCFFWDKDFISKKETRLKIENFFVLMPIKEEDDVLVNFHYCFLKSMNPDAIIIKVPPMNDLSISFQRLKEMGWVNHPKIILNLFLLNIGTDNPAIDEKLFIMFMDFLDKYNISNGLNLFFDNWFTIDQKVLDQIMRTKHLNSWPIKKLDFGLTVSEKIKSIYNFLKKSSFLKEKYDHLLLGPTALISHTKSFIFNDKKTINLISRLRSYWCPKETKNKIELGASFKCDHCNINHKTNAMSACTYCHKMMSFSNLPNHEKSLCLYKFAEMSYLTSVIILLISVGNDAEIRSNIFGQYLQLKQGLNYEENKYMVSRFRADDQNALADTLTTTRVNILSETLKPGEEVAPIVTFVFCDNNIDLDQTSQILFTKLPHLHTLHFSVRIQTEDLISPLKTSNRYSITYVTSQYRYFQMLDFLYFMIANFDQKLGSLEGQSFKICSVQLKEIGTSFDNTSEIVVQLRRFCKLYQERIKENTGWTTFFEEFQKHFYKTNNRKNDERDVDLIFRSFNINRQIAIITGTTNTREIIKFPSNMLQLLSMTCPLFAKNLMLKTKH